MLKKVDDSLIETVLKKARESPRKRYLHCLHKPDEDMQRQINAGLADTYVPPHKHESPDKTEVFVILKGKAAIFSFDNKGSISDSIIIDESGPNKIVEIPPKTWHSFVILSEEAAMYELLDKRYDPKTHKKFAPWAPKEDDKEKAMEYLKELKNRIDT